MVDTKVGFLIEKKQAPAKVGLTAPVMELSALPSTQGLSYQGGGQNENRKRKRKTSQKVSRKGKEEK